MHTALLISEIIVRIFDQYVMPADRLTLAALARTCKAFHEQANDLLWSDIRGLAVFSRMVFPEALDVLETSQDMTFRSKTERFHALIQERKACRKHTDRRLYMANQCEISFSDSFPWESIG
jgi:hypothetical protein